MPWKKALISWSAIMLPPLVPAIFWLVYTPVNHYLTVDAFGCGWTGLLDAPHRYLDCFAGVSSNPRASSSSRTNRFGTLP